MSISQQHPPDVIFEHLDPTRSKRKKASRPSRNPLIRLPIAQRLVLGFLIPALIAALAAGIIGLQSAQLLSQESNFYQNLFKSYASLTTGNDFLQLMHVQLSSTLSDAAAPNPSREQLATDRTAVQGLETRYDTLLTAYIQNDLLTYHPDQAAIFDGAGHSGQAVQQSVLASSTLRTWQVYRGAQDRIMQDIENGHYQDAAIVEHAQGELTYADALSALRQLIQFDGRLTGYVQDATAIQQRNELITTLVAVALVLLAIGVIGWLIYGTLVQRLRQLRGVAQAVQQGQTRTRAVVDGRDEITDVSTSVNKMLDTIVGLLEETRVQRDALVGAAERLFSDMRLANGGELEIKTAVNNDPIGMLGNAFGFTIGRFRRFVIRNQATIEQLDVISQHSMERTDHFQENMRSLLRTFTPSSTGNSWPLLSRSESGNFQDDAQVKALRDQLQRTSYRGVEQNGQMLISLVEQAYRHYQQVISVLRANNIAGSPVLVQELRSLEATLRQISMETRTFQQQSLAEIDTTLNQLSLMVRSASTSGSATGLSSAQVQEFTRLTEGFVQEVTGLAHSLRRITLEMRKNLAPFRVENMESGEVLSVGG